MGQCNAVIFCTKGDAAPLLCIRYTCWLVLAIHGRLCWPPQGASAHQVGPRSVKGYGNMDLLVVPHTACTVYGPAGKRINMKKVIGYIASHFRRDKVWPGCLRPDCQVLLACDDSRSMAEDSPRAQYGSSVRRMCIA